MSARQNTPTRAETDRELDLLCAFCEMPAAAQGPFLRLMQAMNCNRGVRRAVLDYLRALGMAESKAKALAAEWAPKLLRDAA